MPIFEFRSTTEIAVMGCIGDGRTHDWLGFVMRDAPDQPWYFRYRFRYYDAGDPADPDADDTKKVFEMRPNHSTAPPEYFRDAAAAALRSAIALLQRSGFGDDIEILEVNGGPELFNEKMRASGSKFFHTWSFPAGGPSTPPKFNVG